MAKESKKSKGQNCGKDNKSNQQKSNAECPQDK